MHSSAARPVTQRLVARPAPTCFCWPSHTFLTPSTISNSRRHWHTLQPEPDHSPCGRQSEAWSHFCSLIMPELIMSSTLSLSGQHPCPSAGSAAVERKKKVHRQLNMCMQTARSVHWDAIKAASTHLSHRAAAVGWHKPCGRSCPERNCSRSEVPCSQSCDDTLEQNRRAL